MKPKFEPTDDGLEIIDPIERHRYRLTTHESVSLETVDTDRIQFPVDAAVEITAEMITLPTNDMVHIRDKEGSMVAEVQPSKQVSLSRGEYTLDLSGPLKVYACVESAIHVYSDTEHTYIMLDDSTQATIGARSYHRRPAGSITTTKEPNDIMQAVSMFGSALKSTAPERSYPTHRGHPPTIQMGNELNIPEKFERPDTGIRIAIPPKIEHILVVTPLAYYLGAEIVAGKKAHLSTDNGYTCSLAPENNISVTAEKILKQIFFLDCILRAEGLSPFALPEREAIESDLDFDTERLYSQPLPKQIETYLSVPFTTIEPYLPEWRLETRLQPTADSVEFLPFLADTLSIIHIEESREFDKEEQTHTKAIDDFTRSGTTRMANRTRGSSFRSEPSDDSPVQTIEQCWVNNTSSDIQSTTPLSAFYNSIGRKPKEDPISIEVVCNASDMREELQTVNNVYGVHKELPFRVNVQYNLTTEELKETMLEPSDFFHYIGHIDEEGFQCTDGKLDGRLIENVNMKAFLLNACQSYRQGLNLIEAGSIGGIVTLGDVVNSGAINVGETIARLLNQGFPLHAALDITRKESVIGEQYRIVGDGITTIAQSKTRTPTLCTITSNESLTAELTMYVSEITGKGGLFKPYLEPIESYHLLPRKTDPIPVTKSQLKDFLNLEEVPVLYEGELYWSNKIDVDVL